MPQIGFIALFCFVVSLFLTSGRIVAEDSKELEFTPIFDGKTLNGWTPLPGGEWSVKDGAIVGKSAKTEPRHGMLLSEKQYENFIVTAKFRVHSGDSGFYFRSERVKSAVSVNGFQVEIDTSQETGGLYETGGRAWVHNPSKDKELLDARKYQPGEWTDLELTADQRNITVKINSKISSQLENDKGRLKGHFGLQLHGGQEMHVEYKDIRIHVLK